MAKHTPGPWYKVSKFDDELCDNRWHISQSPEGMPYWIAILFSQLPNGQEEANANLIAAAPEMYAQLDNVRTMLDEALTYLDLADVDILIFKQVIKDIEDLLARAEGKEAKHD